MNYADTWAWPDIPVDAVDREEISTLYSFGHYDGPGTGLVLWRGEHWYVARFEIGDPRYWLIRLTPEQQQYAAWYGAEWARLFHSGMSWNADGSRAPEVDGIHVVRRPGYRGMDEAEYARFQAEHKVPSPSNDAEVVGYFYGWRLL